MAHVDAHTMAALLGVKLRRGRHLHSLDLFSEVGKGLSVAALEGLCRLIAPDDPKFCYRIVPKATLARRRQGTGRLNPAESNRLTRVASVWALALDVWKSERAARRILGEPHSLLRNSVPRELAIESYIGARMVEGLLGGLKYGSAV
jgi:putative toxin-antitoxin system antitoxin component (TIGR02293 family)